MHEAPEEGAIREIYEETRLEVEVDTIIRAFHRLAGVYGTANTVYSIYYHCIAVGGTLQTSRESLEVGFFDYREISEWHKDSRDRAEICHRFWQQKMQ